SGARAVRESDGGRPAMTRLLSVFTLAVAMAAAAGCADPNRPKTFSTDWRGDQSKTISDVLAPVPRAKPRPSVDVVVSVSGKDKIIGTPLGQGAQWTTNHGLDARPVIAGDVVIVSGDGEVVALDVGSGKKLWTRPTGNIPLLGAGDDGAISAIA